jgi:hypothetical protein
MTNQEAFDIIVRHLLTQKKKSMSLPQPWDTPICLYRGPDGTKCAVGILISDADYWSLMETRLVDDPIVSSAIPPGVGTGLLMELQQLHDDHEPVTWEEHLRAYALEEGFDFPEVK